MTAAEKFKKEKLPFIIATGGEFVALYFWLHFWDRGYFWLATVLLWAGFLAERLAVVGWVRYFHQKMEAEAAGEAPTGGGGAAAQDAKGITEKTLAQKIFFLGLICLSEITIWVLCVFVYDAYGLLAGFAVLVVGEQLEHSLELGLMARRPMTAYLPSMNALSITLLEALGGIGWLYFVRNGQPLLAAVPLLIGLTIEHVVQGGAIKSDLKKDFNKKHGTPSGTPETSRGWLFKTFKYVGTLLLWLVVTAVVLIECFNVGSVTLPPVQSTEKVVHLEQGWPDGWDPDGKQWFHHADQGSTFSALKYEWFMALEQPTLSMVRSGGLFSDSGYLERFGFLPSAKHDEMNPDGLPIGFAKGRVTEPFPGAPEPPYDVVGFTCAACHTTQINFQGQGIRIEGGPAMANVMKFKKALGLSVAYTYYIPWRFKSFANRVLGDGHSAEESEQLKKSLGAFIAVGSKEKKYADEKHLYDLEEGFARTDALGLILNRVFDDLNPDNLGVADAPVNFPHIWDSTWLDWVQYNASIRTPMTRNIGEALGVGALINTTGKGDDIWRSTVNVRNLWLMEEQLSGDEPYAGLTSPKWPEDVLGKLDPKLVSQGELLYEENCARCHWKMDDIAAALETDGKGPDKLQMWTEPNQYGRRFIKVVKVNLEEIGTDSNQALNFARRVVVTTPGRDMGSAAENLGFITNRVRQLEFEKLGLFKPENKDRKVAFDGYRQPFEEFLQQEVTPAAPAAGEDDRTYAMLYSNVFPEKQDAVVRLAYKARPLNGIWATAPYLHNGSVRTLEQLLLPVAEREKKFYLGSKEFDPQQVGFENKLLPGGFLLDTSLSGNRNTGHEFRDVTEEEKGKPWIEGVLGRKRFTDKERMALVEYLKSL